MVYGSRTSSAPRFATADEARPLRESSPSGSTPRSNYYDDRGADDVRRVAADGFSVTVPHDIAAVEADPLRSSIRSRLTSLTTPAAAMLVVQCCRPGEERRISARMRNAVAEAMDSAFSVAVVPTSGGMEVANINPFKGEIVEMDVPPPQRRSAFEDEPRIFLAPTPALYFRQAPAVRVPWVYESNCKHPDLWYALYTATFVIFNVIQQVFAFLNTSGWWVNPFLCFQYSLLALQALLLLLSTSRTGLRLVVWQFEFWFLFVVFFADAVYQAVLNAGAGEYVTMVTLFLCETLTTACFFSIDATRVSRVAKGWSMLSISLAPILTITAVFANPPSEPPIQVGAMIIPFAEEQRYINVTLAIFCFKYAIAALVRKHDLILIKMTPVLLLQPSAPLRDRITVSAGTAEELGSSAAGHGVFLDDDGQGSVQHAHLDDGSLGEPTGPGAAASAATSRSTFHGGVGEFVGAARSFASDHGRPAADVQPTRTSWLGSRPSRPFTAARVEDFI